MNAQRTACILALVLAIAGVVAVSTALAQGGGNPADIVISEVMFNALTDDGGNLRGEWLEIYNKGSAPIDLTGWGVRDTQGVDIILSSMCPASSCEIPPRGCWLIAVDPISLGQEIGMYTAPTGVITAVLYTSTVFLGSSIGGNGLGNGADGLALTHTTGPLVDCVGWSAPSVSTFCTTLSNTFGYISGGSGVDTSLSGESNGQSITNIQGQWYYHQINASPYNCINTAAGGSPTAIILSAFSARPWLRPGLILAGAVGAGAATLLLRRREGKPRRPLRARAGPCARR